MNRDPLSEIHRRIQQPGSEACPAPESLTELALGATADEESERLRGPRRLLPPLQ